MHTHATAGHPIVAGPMSPRRAASLLFPRVGLARGIRASGNFSLPPPLDERARSSPGLCGGLYPAGAVLAGRAFFQGSGSTPSSASLHSSSQATASRRSSRTFSSAQAESLFFSSIRVLVGGRAAVGRSCGCPRHWTGSFDAPTTKHIHQPHCNDGGHMSHASIVAAERPISKRRDSQPASTTGNDSQTQRDIGGVCDMGDPVFVEDRIVQMCRDELDAINLCIDLSRMSDETLCERLGVDKGHWSRIRKGRAHFPTSKRIALMRLAGNWAPIQYELGISGVGRRLRDAWAASQAERRQDAGQWQSFGAAA